jgi:hypothetical protein
MLINGFAIKIAGYLELVFSVGVPLTEETDRMIK